MTLPGATPETGDVVVREVRRGRELVYFLHTTPNPAQIELKSHAHAVSAAMRYAEAHATCAWIVSADGETKRIADYRTLEPV